MGLLFSILLLVQRLKEYRKIYPGVGRVVLFTKVGQTPYSDVRKLDHEIAYLVTREIIVDGIIRTGPLIIYYIADLPVTPLRVLPNKSDNIAVPYASLRSLILLLSSLSFAFFDSLLQSSWDARLRLA